MIEHDSSGFWRGRAPLRGATANVDHVIHARDGVVDRPAGFVSRGMRSATTGSASANEMCAKVDGDECCQDPLSAEHGYAQQCGQEKEARKTGEGFTRGRAHWKSIKG